MANIDGELYGQTRRYVNNPVIVNNNEFLFQNNFEPIFSIGIISVNKVEFVSTLLVNLTAIESANVPLMLTTELLARPIQTQYNPIAERQIQPIYLPQASEQNIFKICINCIDIVDNNGLECTACKNAYHYICSIPSITNFYKFSNS